MGRKEIKLRRRSPNLELEAGLFYEIPENSSHIGIKKGLLAFFECLDSVFPPEGYKSRRKWRFFEIPKGAIFVCFERVVFTPGGWQISPPEFIYEPPPSER